jgi:ATP-binding cassette subfamily F protein uup
MARAPSNTRAPLLALKEVRLQDGASPLFDGVDLALEPRVRACLVGRNGAGKSTLLKVLAGMIEPDAGERTLTSAVRVVMVPQEPLVEADTLRDYACSGAAQSWTAEAALETFGLDPDRPARNLSGGENRRAALARAFAEEPDLILLDEPTNHLDIFAIETLEAELAASRAAALIVSHDRAFLNRVTARCFWLAHRKVRMLDMGFEAFEPWAEKVEAEEAEQLRRLDKAIERETYWFYRSITAQRTRNEGRARELRAMRLERGRLMKDQPKQVELAIDAGGTSGKIVAEVKGATKAYGDKVLLKGFSTRVLRGDRVAIVGPNGAGKTTLVKILLGETAPDSGTVRLGTQLDIAYLDQTRDELKAEMTLWDALANSGSDQIMVRGQPRHVAAYAKEFLFRDNQLRQPVASLSGGERNRLLLARALAKPANLLVLDEPTNDLDMDTLDLLEDVLADYEGTLILVSHDRDFIDRLATSTIALNGHGDAVETPGGWTDFRNQNPDFFDAPKIVEAKAPAPAVEAPRPAEAKKPAKLSFKDAHRLKELDTLMPKLHAEIVRHEQTLTDPDLFARDPKAFARTMSALDAARAALAAGEEEWLEIEARREALDG